MHTSHLPLSTFSRFLIRLSVCPSHFHLSLFFVGFLIWNKPFRKLTTDNMFWQVCICKKKQNNALHELVEKSKFPTDKSKRNLNIFAFWLARKAGQTLKQIIQQYNKRKHEDQFMKTNSMTCGGRQ